MKGSFYGWYLKCQSDTQTLAVILPFIAQEGSKRVLFKLLRKKKLGQLRFWRINSVRQRAVFSSGRINSGKKAFVWQ